LSTGNDCSLVIVGDCVREIGLRGCGYRLVQSGDFVFVGCGGGWVERLRFYKSGGDGFCRMAWRELVFFNWFVIF